MPRWDTRMRSRVRPPYAERRDRITKAGCGCRSSQPGPSRIAKNPNQKRLPIAVGAIQSQQAAIYDLFPTILALAGIDVPKNHITDGSRLDAMLTGQALILPAKQKFLMHYPHSPHRSDYFTCYRLGDWKVIYHYYPSEASEGSHYQLYNLAEDPFEQKNLAKQEPERLRSMMRELIAGLEQQQALYPVEKDGKTPRKPQLPE